MAVKTSCLDVSAWMEGQGHIMGCRVSPGMEAPGWLQVSLHWRMYPCNSSCHLLRDRGAFCAPSYSSHPIPLWYLQR